MKTRTKKVLATALIIIVAVIGYVKYVEQNEAQAMYPTFCWAPIAPGSVTYGLWRNDFGSYTHYENNDGWVNLQVWEVYDLETNDCGVGWMN